MSTWHQDRAARRRYEQGVPVRLNHPKLFTVVSSPPNQTMCLERVATLEEAQRKGSRPNCYWLLPDTNPELRETDHA